MNIVRFGIWAATCVALSACTGLFPKPLKLNGCYPLNTLSAKQKSDLYVGRGNPILLVGGKKIVCTCYQGGSISGTWEGGRVSGTGEEGHLSGLGEEGHVSGTGEEGRVSGTGEEGHLSGLGEEGHVSGTGEEDRVSGTGEEDRVSGTGEVGRVSGKSSKLSCRIVPECSGFQLTGYAPKTISVLTKTGQKSVSTNCITW